jgi:alkylhydroperoxidase family enzyme/predicted MFS family arabinose efflux permease
MRAGFDTQTTSPAPSIAAACFVGISALAVAMGIGRFAFTPLLPLMVRDGSLAQDAGAWLAASNYLGYFAGALVAGRVPVTLPTLIRLSLIGTAGVTAAMGATEGLAMWIALRFTAGVLSAWTLVATSVWVLRVLSSADRTDASGIVYAGVGLGIAVVGVFCAAVARPGTSAGALWLELGALAAIAVAIPSLLSRDQVTTAPNASTPPTSPRRAVHTASRPTGIVICYGLFGFGYILPATFLPALARELMDDPQMFGLAWPVFGLAAAASTVVAARYFGRANRLRVWASSHLLMAVGVILPSLWLSPATIAIAALLVGGTFMVVTMVGLQEARARAPDNPTAILGRMTAAFATGQLAGPLASAALDLLPVGHLTALGYALKFAAFGLAASAAVLWRLSKSPHSRRSDAMPQSTVITAISTGQGFAVGAAERLPLPSRDAMSEAQRAAADAIMAGPRKAMFGPFVPLLQCPTLMEHIGKTGEALRFQGSLPERIRELVICAIARETSNQFEWQAHAPTAAKLGLAQAAIDALAAGRRPRGLAAEEETAVDFAAELMKRHGVSDETYAEAVRCFGEPGAVELVALVGYFVMVSWVMNVARTPGPAGSHTAPLSAFPA